MLQYSVPVPLALSFISIQAGAQCHKQNNVLIWHMYQRKNTSQNSDYDGRFLYAFMIHLSRLNDSIVLLSLDRNVSTREYAEQKMYTLVTLRGAATSQWYEYFAQYMSIE